MKKFIKVILALTAFIFIAPTFTSLAQAQEEFVFIVRSNGDPSSFNPVMRSDDNAWPINQNIFNRLVKLNANDSYVADLAESWEYSDDNMQLTFHLHEGVTWHDGEPFSSEDVKWTYDTIIEESWAKSDTFDTVESIDTPDENTVVFNMKQPDASFISKVAWYATFILPKHLYEGTDYATNPHNQDPIGTGPFKFEDYQTGVAVTLTKNEDYFKEIPEIDTLIFSIIPEDSTAYQALLSGEIDYMSALPSAEANSLDDNEDFEIVQQLGINRTYLTYNLEVEELQDIEVRKAMSLAINRQGIWDRVANGTGQVADTFISPVFEEYVNEDYLLPEPNTEEAIKTLEDAGYERNENGYFFEFTLDAFEDGNFGDIATIVRDNLEQAGIGVTLNLMEYSAWQTKVMDDADFELSMLAGYQGPDISGIAGRVSSTGSTNIAGYSNPEMDEALLAGAEESDVEARKPHYDTVQRLMSEDLPIILLIDNGYKIPIHKDFTGLPEQEHDRAASSEMTYVRRTAEE